MDYVESIGRGESILLTFGGIRRAKSGGAGCIRVIARLNGEYCGWVDLYAVRVCHEKQENVLFFLMFRDIVD